MLNGMDFFLRQHRRHNMRMKKMQSHDNVFKVVKTLGTRVGSIGFANLSRDSKLLPRNNIYQFHTINITCIPITFLSKNIGVNKTTTIFSFLSLNLWKKTTRYSWMQSTRLMLLNLRLDNISKRFITSTLKDLHWTSN